MTNDIPQQYFEEPMVTELERMRSETRKKRRITFDCFHAKVFGNYVRCAKGYPLRGLQSLTTLAVLRGVSCSVCKVCPDYDDSETKKGRKKK